jgi:hypothetical protein
MRRVAIDIPNAEAYGEWRFRRTGVWNLTGPTSEGLLYADFPKKLRAHISTNYARLDARL